MPRALPPGVTKTKNGYRVFVRVRRARGVSELLSKSFPSSTPLDELKAWRESQRVEARKAQGPTPVKGTFADDVQRYLRQVAAMPTLEWRTRDLAAWTLVFGNRRRQTIGTDEIRGQLHEWRTVGPITRFDPRTKTYTTLHQPLSASACNHRRTALLHLWTVLDGKAAPNPVRDVPPFKEPHATPRGRDIASLSAAIDAIQAPLTRARARVLLWTGIRGNSELSKMTREHVDLDQRICYVPSAKGGKFRIVALNDSGVEAWREFIALNAWGTYDRSALRVSLHRACIRAGLGAVRPYDLRHSISASYLVAGADLADIQQMLGHTTPRMTRRYAPFHAGKLLGAAEQVHQRLTIAPAVEAPHYGPKLTDAHRAEIVRRHRAGESYSALGREFGVSDVAIRKAVARAARGEGLR